MHRHTVCLALAANSLAEIAVGISQVRAVTSVGVIRLQLCRYIYIYIEWERYDHGRLAGFSVVEELSLLSLLKVSVCQSMTDGVLREEASSRLVLSNMEKKSSNRKGGVC